MTETPEPGVPSTDLDSANIARAIGPRSGPMCREVSAALDDVLLAAGHLRTWLKPPYPPASASLADGLRHYGGPGAVFDLWAGWRAMERLRAAWDAFPTAADNPVSNGAGADQPRLTAARTPSRPSMHAIQTAVCVRYRVGLPILLGASRIAEVVFPRHLAMWLARRRGYSLAEIGAAFGRRDHTTIHHAVRRIDRMMAEDAVLASTLLALAADVSARAADECVEQPSLGVAPPDPARASPVQDGGDAA